MYAQNEKIINLAKTAADRTAPTLLMGILNVTPDSFSDGGDFVAPDNAVRQALAMVRQGADIIDVGGETTRPGSEPITAETEMSRVVPVIKQITAETDVCVSIDTRRADVAAAALDAGACIVNDVSGFRFDPDMIELLADKKPIAVALHMRGTPSDMQSFTDYDSVIDDIISEIMPPVEQALMAGLPEDRIWLDPGIGFAKTAEQCVKLISGIGVFAKTGYPILIGPSRKSFIGVLTGQEEPKKRIFGTAAAVTASVLNGARIIRIHDVAEMRDVIIVADALAGAGYRPGTVKSDGSN